MSNGLQIAPEGFDLANTYLEKGNIEDTAKALCISRDKVVEILAKTEVKRYIDSIYMDMGYRNRNKLGGLLDEIIESKLEEARESEMFTSKDLVDLIQLSHKMRMDEIKAQQTEGNIKNQTNVQINDNSNQFGQGNYGALMKKLMGGSTDAEIVED